MHVVVNGIGNKENLSFHLVMLLNDLFSHLVLIIIVHLILAVLKWAFYCAFSLCNICMYKSEYKSCLIVKLLHVTDQLVPWHGKETS